MTIQTFTLADYYLDGGTIRLEFVTNEGASHRIEIVHEMYPVGGPSSEKRNGDVFLDAVKITARPEILTELTSAFSQYLDDDTRQEHILPPRKRTLYGSNDLKDLMTRDEVGYERQVICWAIERMQNRIDGVPPGPHHPIRRM